MSPMAWDARSAHRARTTRGCTRPRPAVTGDGTTTGDEAASWRVSR